MPVDGRRLREPVREIDAKHIADSSAQHGAGDRVAVCPCRSLAAGEIDDGRSCNELALDDASPGLTASLFEPLDNGVGGGDERAGPGSAAGED